MLVKTLLNSIEKHKCFVYDKDRLVDCDGCPQLEVEISPRKNSRARCSGCGASCPGYDRLDVRRFEYVPLWAIPVFFVYAMRRVNCPDCGIKVEEVPWAAGKHQHTRSYSRFLAKWAQRLSWSEVAEVFGTTWNRVYDAVRWVVSYGREHQDLSEVTAIGVDEIAYKKGHNYLTVVYQINQGSRRLLWAGIDRTEATLKGFFSWFGEEHSEGIEFVCSDMWKPYLNAIRDKAKNALNVLDRYHIMANMNKAIDKTRRKEVQRLKERGCEPVLTKSRWCLLKRVHNLTTKQTAKLDELLAYNLRTVKAYLMKEDFHRFWNYVYPRNAEKFLESWCQRAMYSRIEPMKDVARSLRSHRHLILNYFRARKEINSGVVEGFNNKIKTTTKRSYGFRVPEVLITALYHQLGELPWPPATHEF
ncbi:MAG: ISL3 family transposase [Planctomycetota bacterium]|nr:ISL3 family transposase [Planctomycetota bacterium]MDA1142069.1 ISL3 family transposase [Planctomycetota bacterium]